MIKRYEDLLVYKQSYELSLEMHRLSLLFPKTEQYELASQLRRATKSIPMNIAEGYGKKASETEFKRFLTIALGSSNEVLVQLRYCCDLGYMDETQYEHFTDSYNVIGKMLSKLIETWQSSR